MVEYPGLAAQTLQEEQEVGSGTVLHGRMPWTGSTDTARRTGGRIRHSITWSNARDWQCRLCAASLSYHLNLCIPPVLSVTGVEYIFITSTKHQLI